MVTYETEITIDARPDAVWKHLIDVGRHDEWSQHFKLRGRPVVGAPGRIEFSLFGVSTRADIVFQEVDEPHELRWHGGTKRLAYGSHFCILEGIDGGQRTRFRHGETFSGVLAPLVWLLLKADLGPSYKGFNEELRQRVAVSTCWR